MNVSCCFTSRRKEGVKQSSIFSNEFPFYFEMKRLQSTLGNPTDARKKLRKYSFPNYPLFCYSGRGRSCSRVHGLHGRSPQVPDRRREIPWTPSGCAGLTTAPCTTPRSGPSTAELSSYASSVICALGVI